MLASFSIIGICGALHQTVAIPEKYSPKPIRTKLSGSRRHGPTNKLAILPRIRPMRFTRVRLINLLRYGRAKAIVDIPRTNIVNIIPWM